jgi:hypothetical protein
METVAQPGEKLWLLLPFFRVAARNLERMKHKRYGNRAYVERFAPGPACSIQRVVANILASLGSTSIVSRP